MQEEVTGKSVALIISSAKMTEQVLDRAIRAYLDRKKQPKIYRGKQTLKQLAGQNADAITAAFQEFTARKLHRKPSLRAQLAKAVKEAEMQPKPLEKELVKEKNRGVER